MSEFFNSRLSQLERKSHTEPSSFEYDLAEINWAINKLTAIKKSIPWDIWLEQFWELLANLNEISQKSIIKVLSKESLDKLASNFKRDGAPITKLAFKLFWKKYWIETIFLSIEERKEQENRNVDKANIESLTEIYNSISDRSDSSPAFVLLKQLAEWNEQAYKDLKLLLLAEPEQLKSLVATVKEFDREHQTNHYEALRHTLISVDPVFQWMLDEISNDSIWEEKVMTFPQAYVYSLSGDNPKLNGSILESKNNHWDKISIDMSKEPPLRELSLVNSEYSLEADRSIGLLHKPEFEFSKKRNELNSQLKVLNVLQSNLIQGHIEDLTTHGYTLPEIQHHLKLVYKIDVGFIDSIDELSSPSNLETMQKEVEGELKSLESKYLQSMKEAINLHREEIYEQDEKTREVLQFISGIGFDLISKKFTDQIISEVKSGVLMINKVSLNPANLDLKNGIFWEPETEQGSTKWKKNLVEFYNLMISWNPKEPIDVESHIWTFWKSEDKTKMKHLLISNGILTDSGNFNIEKARTNLSTEK